MPVRTLVLASASPARRRLLEEAGIDPIVRVSGVNEDDGDPTDTPGTVSRFASRKAGAIASSGHDGLVLGCDSMLEFEGRSHGKPASHDEARSWLTSMRGRDGILYTGYHLIDEATGNTASAVVGTTVHFGTTTDAELDAYLATPDALAVAGAFTLDGRSAPFVDGIDGDYGNVIGLSLPTLRSLLSELGLSVTDLWREATR